MGMSPPGVRAHCAACLLSPLLTISHTLWQHRMHAFAKALTGMCTQRQISRAALSSECIAIAILPPHCHLLCHTGTECMLLAGLAPACLVWCTYVYILYTTAIM